MSKSFLFTSVQSHSSLNINLSNKIIKCKNNSVFSSSNGSRVQILDAIAKLTTEELYTNMSFRWAGLGMNPQPQRPPAEHSQPGYFFYQIIFLFSLTVQIVKIGIYLIRKIKI